VSAPAKSVVLMDDLAWDDEGGGMEFRLTYDGSLLASNSGRHARPARKEDKRRIRRRFHGNPPVTTAYC
jgi:hypothetical protein